MPDERPDEEHRTDQSQPQESEPPARKGALLSDGQEAAPREQERMVAAALHSGPAGEPIRVVGPAERKRMNRREMLKLVPVLAVGAFAVTKFRQPLLDEGLAFSDWASGKLFGTSPAGANVLQQRRGSVRSLPLQLLRCR